MASLNALVSLDFLQTAQVHTIPVDHGRFPIHGRLQTIETNKWNLIRQYTEIYNRILIKQIAAIIFANRYIIVDVPFPKL